jgi:AcrR family transcriptional regulator
MNQTIPSLSLTPKRLEIADAALRVIGNQGVAALTTATLAAELGVSSGAPFRHFSNREEILEAVALRVEELVEATMPDCRCDPLDRVRQLFLARTQTVGKHTGIARLMFSDQVSLALPGHAADRLKGLVTRTQAFLLDALKESSGKGEIRTDLTPEDLLPIVLGTLQYLVFAHSLGPDRHAKVEGVTATLMKILRAT